MNNQKNDNLPMQQTIFVDMDKEYLTGERQKLQKSLRSGLLNVVKSVDNLNDTVIDQSDFMRMREERQVERQDKKELKDIELAREANRGAPQAAVGGGRPSMFSGLGRGIGRAGIGLGALAAGGGILAGGTAMLLKSLQDMDAKKIRENVEELLSLSESFKGGGWEVFKKTGSFVSTMTGIGTGLAVFAVGSVAVNAAQRFEKPEWAENIRKSVLTLLSIKDGLGGNMKLLGDSGTFLAAMTGIGAGLAGFGLGSTVANASYRFEKEGWAQNIKNNVLTLLSIKDELGGNIKLLKDGGTLSLALAGIGTSLAIFGAGSGIASFMSNDFAKKIKMNVETLLEIGDSAKPKKADDVEYVLGTIGKALGKFTSRQFFSSIKNAGTSIFGFLGGPIEEFLELANKTDDIAGISVALDDVADSMERMSRLDLKAFNLKKFANDLKAAVPIIEVAVAGGKLDGGAFGKDMEIKGLASPEINYELATMRMRELQSVFMNGNPTRGSGGLAGAQVSEATREVREIQKGVGVVSPTVIAPTNITNAQSTRVSSTTVASASPIHRNSPNTRKTFGSLGQ